MLLHSDWLFYHSNNIFKLLLYADFLVIYTIFIYEYITDDTEVTTVPPKLMMLSISEIDGSGKVINLVSCFTLNNIR
jgi:hypothetical protein